MVVVTWRLRGTLSRSVVRRFFFVCSGVGGLGDVQSAKADGTRGGWTLVSLCFCDASTGFGRRASLTSCQCTCCDACGPSNCCDDGVRSCLWTRQELYLHSHYWAVGRPYPLVRRFLRIFTMSAWKCIAFRCVVSSLAPLPSLASVIAGFCTGEASSFAVLQRLLNCAELWNSYMQKTLQGFSTGCPGHS